MDMMERGYQTPLGFLFDGDSLRVGIVEPGSPAARRGLKPDDVIVEVNGNPASRKDQGSLAANVQLTVIRNDRRISLPAFQPTSIGLYPTQIYETISMLLLLFFLLSYFPFRRGDGELMVFLMLGYGVHRFFERNAADRQRSGRVRPDAIAERRASWC